MTAQNIESEQSILGACMSPNAHAFIDAALIIQGTDFYRPAHEAIWDVIAQLHIDHVPADPVIVADRFGAEVTRIGGHVYLFELLQRMCVPASVTYHAQIIADAATLRRVESAGQRMAQRASDPNVNPAELVKWAGDQLAVARDERMGVEVLTSPWDAFIHSTPEEREMVVPGLLGVGDRLVLTGHGGLGKSTMLQQIAVCAAAGIPPFDWIADDPYEPVSVSILDFENADHRTKTRLWPMVNDCMQMGCDPRPNLNIGGGGNPLNLLNPQNALSLLRTIEHDNPKLVYIGPVYKMHNDDPDKESVVKKITDVLDSIRAMGAAIITEAHHTKEGKKGGSLEPSGSNLWTWWPEFGLGLRLDPGPNNNTRRCILEGWRINREVAMWPDEVESSGKLGLAWARADIRGPAARPALAASDWDRRGVAS